MSVASTTDPTAPPPPATAGPTSSNFGTMMSQFGQGVSNSLGGDTGNIFPGYRDMRSQIVDTQHKAAETEDLSAHAEHQRMVNASQKLQAQRMQQLAQRKQQVLNTAESQVQAIIDASALDFAAGDVVAGSEKLEKAAVIQSHLATAKREQDQQAVQQFTQHEKIMADQAAIWAGINSPEDQARAAVQWADSHRPTEGQPPVENPFNVPYDPKNIEFRRNTSAQGMKYLDEQRTLATAKQNQADKESAIRFRDSRIAQGKAEQKLRQEREARLAKGGMVPAPGKALQAEAVTRVGDKYPNIATNEGATAGYDIASRAMEIVRGNPGVGMAKALDMAFTESEKANNFQTIEKNYELFKGVDIPWVKDTKTKYDPKAEGTAANPAALPQSGKREDLVANRIYHNGKISMRWNGKSWDALSANTKEEALDAGEGIDEEGNVVTPEETE